MRARKCANCGAAPKEGDAEFCSYCGTELPRRPEPARAAPPSPYGDVQSRFVDLARHPDLPRAMRHTPSGAKHLIGLGCGIAFSILFITVSMVIMGGMDLAEAPFPFTLFPFLFVGIGLAIGIVSLVKLVSFSNSPLMRKPAVVVGERTRVSGGGNNSSASTNYYLTVEFENGRRKEYATDGRTVGIVSEGDMGVAYLKGDVLLAFDRFRV